MDKLAAMRAFVEICDQGSLTAAGERLGKSQPTMVRTLANLEQTLGVRLLRRTTRRLSLTDEGRGYLTQCRRILSDIQQAEAALAVGATEPRGQLRITAPVTFGQLHVAPLAVDFIERFPQVRLDLLLLDRVVNLLEEGIDLAVRIGPLVDSSMIARPVGSMRRVLAASPKFLAARGVPSHPNDLAGAPCVLFRGQSATDSWRFFEQQRPLDVGLKTVYATNQATPAVDGCARGLGFGLFLHYQVAAEVAAGRLQIVLPDFEPVPAPVSLVYSDARLMSPSLRALLDFVAAGLSASLKAQPG